MEPEPMEAIPEVDSPLAVELHKRWTAARVTFGDVYSAVCRPGSWEFALPAAALLRELLQQNGYAATRDPEATWRLIWRRPCEGGTGLAIDDCHSRAAIARWLDAHATLVREAMETCPKCGHIRARRVSP